MRVNMPHTSSAGLKGKGASSHTLLSRFFPPRALHTTPCVKNQTIFLFTSRDIGFRCYSGHLPNVAHAAALLSFAAAVLPPSPPPPRGHSCSTQPVRVAALHRCQQ